MGIFNNFLNSFKKQTIYIGGVGNSSAPRSFQVNKNDICASIFDCTATHVSKGKILHIKEKDGRVVDVKRNSAYTKLFQNPNPLMTRSEFLYAMAWQLLTCDTAFAWVRWSAKMEPLEVYPLAYLSFNLREIKGGGYAVEFYDFDGKRQIVDSRDLIVLRKKFDGTGFAGRGNAEIVETLETSKAINDALKQASEISNKLNGVLKQKKAMLSSSGTAQAEANTNTAERLKFAAEHGGVLTLDAMEDYLPIEPKTWSANAEQYKQISDRIYSYWRTPESVVNNTATEQEMQNYFDSVIEPIWEMMSEAFANALFTKKERDNGERFEISAGAANGASWQTRLNIITDTKEIGVLSVNEYRELLGYPPEEDGDERLVSLNYIKAKDQSKYQTGENEDE